MYTERNKKRLYSSIAFLLACILFVLLVLQRVQLDLWNDEIYTLKHFVLVSLSTTITDYHVPNNHILFNLINNLYAQLIGVRSLAEALERPVLLRLLPLIYSLLTILFFYRMVKKNADGRVAFLSVALLISTVSYINFFLQLRGYGLSILLVLLVVINNLNFLKEGRHIQLLAMVLFSTMALYTIPSNVYFLGALGIINISYLAFLKRLQCIAEAFSSKRFVFASLALLVSLVFAALLYRPVIDQLISNRYVVSTGLFNFESLGKILPSLLGWVSNRWPLFLIAIWGFVAMKKHYGKWHMLISFCLMLILLPFVLSFVRGDNPPSRVFVVGVPYVMVLFAMGIQLAFDAIERSLGKKMPWMIAAIVLYMVANYAYVNSCVSQKIENSIRQEKRDTNLYHQYYSFHYEPNREMDFFQIKYAQSPLPVIVKGCELHGIPNYLDQLDIPWTYIATDDSLITKLESFYMITNHPFKVYPGYESDLLSEDLTYHNVLKMIKKD